METKIDKRAEYGAFKLRKDTIKLLKNIQSAFEFAYGHEFTNDDFIKQLVACIENGDPGVWEIYGKILESQSELEKMGEKARQERS